MWCLGDPTLQSLESQKGQWNFFTLRRLLLLLGIFNSDKNLGLTKNWRDLGSLNNKAIWKISSLWRSQAKDQPRSARESNKKLPQKQSTVQTQASESDAIGMPQQPKLGQSHHWEPDTPTEPNQSNTRILLVESPPNKNWLKTHPKHARVHSLVSSPKHDEY